MSQRPVFPALLAVAVILIIDSSVAHAATISLSPNVGTFVVGSTFTASIFIDTKGQSVNAVDVYLHFSPDQLQIVSPTIGQSIVGVWTSPLQYDNQNGLAHFQGGIPGGINVSQGLISTVTFRVRKVGAAIVKFSGDSKVLLNDGKGTNALENFQNGIFSLVFPPPAGPVVASPTDPDQSQWYSNSSVTFTWANSGSVEGYSYMLSDDPIAVPDNIVEGTKNSVAYENIADGTHYFHIKALRDGAWGGVSHFAVNIDLNPPAKFSMNIQPSQWTTDGHLIISFSTTDFQSGMNHYEYATIPVSVANAANADETVQPFFAEAESSIALGLENGTYDIIVRAYDNAGNVREEIARVHIVTPLVAFFINPWIMGAAVILLLLLGYFARRVYKWRLKLSKTGASIIPKPVAAKIKELKKYREKYGKLAIVLMLFSASLLFGIVAGVPSVHSAGLIPVSAQSVQPDVSVSPPIITTVSRDISNDEIFYVGGTTAKPNTAVLIYLQNSSTGEVTEQATVSDAQGKWFYRHNSFLDSGRYILWAEAKSAEALSPPSPQEQIAVTPTALQFGSSRLSYETLYLGLSLLLFLIVIVLAGFTAIHGFEGYKKHRRFVKEIREVEEAVRRGFAIIKHDIEMELAVIKRAQLDKDLSVEEKERETQLLKDLERVQTYIGKEVFDVEKIGFS